MSGLNIATALYSTADSWKKYNAARDAEEKLTRLQSPTYQRNQSILDYYQKALQKYETNPTETAAYKQQKQQIGQGVTQAISGARDRRLGGAIIPSVIQGANNSLLKAAVEGEKRKAQELGVLGNAAQLKAGEDQKAFQYNSISPYEKNYNLLAMKAAGSAQAGNAALQNAYNNLLAADATKSDTDSGTGKNTTINIDWSSIFGSKKNKRTKSESRADYTFDDSLPVNG